MRLLVLASVLVLAVSARPSEACSPAATYIKPTNVELVADSPRIVIAIARRVVGDDIEMEVAEVLRGAGVKATDTFTVRGTARRYMGRSSNNLDFSQPRRGAYAGGCTAYDYALDHRYLLLLAPSEGTWHVRSVAFTRVNEEVDDANDPWVIAVREYARIAELKTPADRKKALTALMAKGKGPNVDPVDRAIADDIVTHIVTPTPAKSFAELEALENAGVVKQESVFVAIATGGDPAARAYMRKVVDALRVSTAKVNRLTLEAVSAYYEKVSDPAVIAALAEYYVALGKQAMQTRWPLMWLLIHRADASDRLVMERALARAGNEEAGKLADWFVRFPSATAEKELLARLGDTFGRSHLRSRDDMLLALAGMGNRAVVAWAKGIVTSPTAPTDDDRWAAVHALARSPLPEADALVPAILKRGGEDLELLVQAYRDARHPRADRRLAEIAKLRTLDADLRASVKRAIEHRKQR